MKELPRVVIETRERVAIGAELVRINRARRHHLRMAAKLDDDLWGVIKKTRKHLSKQEYQIMKLRYHDHKTLEQVGLQLGITRESVRQKESHALFKLRAYEING